MGSLAGCAAGAGEAWDAAAFTGPAWTFRAGPWAGFDAATDGGGFVRKEANGDNGGGEDTAAGADALRASLSAPAVAFSRCR